MARLRACDLFCGAGGSTEGAESSGVVSVQAAVNHWRLAVETHRANHPHVLHICQDAALIDPAILPKHDILLASPECRGHTHARGVNRVHHDKSRATAWCVINVSEITRPACIIVENVPEFRRWQLYPQWRSSLETLGYKLSEHVLDAADFGVPQHRVRLFVVASRSRRPLDLRWQRMFHVPVKKILDLDSGNWSPVKGHCRNTVDRVRRGRSEFGKCFVMPYYGSGSGETGRSLDRPLGTVTTRDRWAVVRGNEMRMLTVPEYSKAMGFPEGYRLHGARFQQIHQLGNAVAPGVMRSVCESVAKAI